MSFTSSVEGLASVGASSVPASPHPPPLPLPPTPTVGALMSSLLIPPKPAGAPIAGRRSRTVVLDMDETLLHSVRVQPPETSSPASSASRAGRDAAAAAAAADSVVGVRRGNTISLDWPDGYSLRAVLRPGLDDFLAFVARNFEVILWTAGTRSYASEIVRILDPGKSLFSHVIFRSEEWFHNADDGQGYVKDLSRLARPLSSVVLVDNSPFVCRYNYDNAIIVKDWDRAAFRRKDDAFARVQSVLSSWLKAGPSDSGEPACAAAHVAASSALYHTQVGDDVYHTTYPVLRLFSKL